MNISVYGEKETEESPFPLGEITSGHGRDHLGVNHSLCDLERRVCLLTDITCDTVTLVLRYEVSQELYPACIASRPSDITP